MFQAIISPILRGTSHIPEERYRQLQSYVSIKIHLEINLWPVFFIFALGREKCTPTSLVRVVMETIKRFFNNDLQFL
jgi:hypothetical protein